jgi:hypothetical protein
MSFACPATATRKCNFFVTYLVDMLCVFNAGRGITWYRRNIMRSGPLIFIGAYMSITIVLTIIVLLILIALSGFWSCSNSYTEDKVDLEFAPGSAPVSCNIPFNEKGSMVVRCSSLIENERGISFKTSTSSEMKANNLIFIKMPETANPVGVVQIVSAPTKGEEHTYSLEHARLYIVTAKSANQIAQLYGMPYDDWVSPKCDMTGTTAPCCCE